MDDRREVLESALRLAANARRVAGDGQRTSDEFLLLARAVEEAKDTVAAFAASGDAPLPPALVAEVVDALDLAGADVRAAVRRALDAEALEGGPPA